MSRTLRARLAGLAVLFISTFFFCTHAAAQTPGSIAVHPSGIVYYAKAGDTLSAIASAYTTRAANWSTLGSLNHIERDKLIPIGTPISIPADLLQDEADEGKVIARNGTIVATYPDGSQSTLNVGSRIIEGMVLNTGANSFLTIGLPDHSRISIPSNSQARVSLLRKTLYTASPRVEISLEKGRVTSRVSPLQINKGSYKVRTPVSVAGVRGTEFRVRLNNGDAATEVIDGHVLASVSRENEGKLLDPAQGNFTSRTSSGPALALQPAPQLDGMPWRQDSRAYFEVIPQKEAAQYQVQLASDADMLDMIAEARGPAHAIILDNIQDGSYFARLSAIDNNGLEGMPRTVAVTIRDRAVATKELPIPGAPFVADSHAPELILRWQGLADTRYHVQVARDLHFSWLTYNSSVTGTEARFPRPAFGTYYARIQAIDADDAIYSSVQPLIVTDQWIINDGQPLRPADTRRRTIH